MAPDKADQELAEQDHRRAETDDSVGGKAKAVPLPQALKNTRVLTVSGAALLALVVATVWLFAPRFVPVEITRAPAGTTVRVKSTGQKCVVPVCTIELRPGQYELELSHPGYVTHSQSISVQAKGPNTFPITLGEPLVMATAQPPAVALASPPLATLFGRLELRGVPSGELFVDGASIGKVGRNGEISAKLPLGQHHIKVLANGKSSSIVSRNFEPGRVVTLGKDDFYPSTPPSPEEVAWQSALSSPSIESVDQFLEKYQNGSHTTEARAMLEGLYWTRDSQTNTADSYRDYLSRYADGPHAPAASEGIEDLKRAEDQAKENQRFQEASNSSDEATLRAFLKEHPSGPPHDQIYRRLDDVIWGKTQMDDVTSLRAYVEKMSDGKYVSQAREQIEKLTEVPKPSKSPGPTVDARAEVLKLVERYVQAYNDTSIQELTQIWPNMDQKQVSRLRDFFREAQNVQSSYTLLEEPKVNGADATVRIAQITTFVLEGQQQRQSGTLTLKLKLAPGTSGSWEIIAVSSE